jgi:hypothetical protein
MRVIKPGYNEAGWSDQVTCKRCRVVLEIFKEDLVSRHTHDIHGPRDEAVVFCPKCQALIVYGPAEKFDGLPKVDRQGRPKEAP